MAETRKRKTSSSGRNKTGTAKRGRPSRGREPEKEEFLQSEVCIMISFALAVLLFLSNFRLCGVFGLFLRGVQLGLFGSVGFVAPLFLFVGTCFYIANRGNARAMMKMGAVIGAVLVLCALAQLTFGTPPGEEGKIMDCYRLSYDSGKGGGLAGGIIAYGISGLLGTVGAYLVLLVLFAICAVLITEKSLVSFVRKGGSKAYRYAREDIDRRMVIHAERREEQRHLREERRVRGVNMGAIILNDMEYPDGEYEEELEKEYEERDAYRYSAETSELEDELDTLNQRLSEQGKEEKAISRIDSRGESQKPSSADIFTGKITPPGGMDEDEIPFDIDALEEVKSAVKRPSAIKAASAAIGKPKAENQDIEIVHIRNPKEKDWLGQQDEGQKSQRKQPEWEKEGSLRIEPDAESFPERTERKTVGLEKEEKNKVLQTESETVRPAIERPEFDDWIPAEELLSIQTIPDITPEPDSARYIRPSEVPPHESPSNDGPLQVASEEGTRRVVTANGKIIEKDTELLRKRVEQKREEAREEGNLSVASQILEREKEAEKQEYVFPALELLKKGTRTGAFSDREYKETAIKLQQTLKNFGVGVTVTNISCGPSVTRYELHPEQGVKVSRIVGLADDIKLSLAAADIRIEAPIPGKAAVGIEVPNKENSIVFLRELLESDNFQKHPSRLAFAVGKDIGGQVVVTDIGKMPHLLIAGATGSGKSVCINTLIMSLIYKADPEDVKLIMVDPKVVELSIYNGIPHLLIPVVTDPKKASAALNWAVAEMSERYQKFAEYSVRDLKGYNEKIKNIQDIDDENKPEKMPQIVIIIDELADLMMVAPGEVEDSICRLAQLARAAGIHLVIATQRPSVNVITGLIKANVPSRIAFAVSSGVDSRTIIDMNGAEKLLGKGDMLFYPSGYPKPQRVQGAFVSDSEVQEVVDFLKEQGMTPQYSKEVENKMASPSLGGADKGGDRDDYFIQAGKFIIEKEKASIGMLQRMFKIGFNRAARIMEQLAEAGVVGEEEGTKPRKVLMSMEEFDEMLEHGL